jgi:peptidoglycan/LPS O-acetylase OafA/YrhL
VGLSLLILSNKLILFLLPIKLIILAPDTSHQQDFHAAEKLEYIDVLRAIAILMVIFVHNSQTVSGLSAQVKSISEYSQFGVQLFFVASAYTLCLSQTQRIEEENQLSSFFVRRFFRIAPLYYFAIVWYFLTDPFNNILKIINVTPHYDFINVLANIFLVHGFVPFANNNIVPGGWSIGAEMAFYALFPMLFRLFSWAHSKWGLLPLYGFVILSVLLNITVQMLISQVLSIELVSDPFIYRNLINQLPVFLIGMTIFFYHQYNHESQVPIIAQAVFFAGMTLFLELLFDDKQPWVLVTVTVCSGMSFAVLLNILRELKYSNKILEEIGKISYSMYIFHFGFVWYLVPGLKMNLEGLVEPHLLLILSFILSVVSTFWVAKLSYRYIESPGILLGKYLIAKLQ